MNTVLAFVIALILLAGCDRGGTILCINADGLILFYGHYDYETDDWFVTHMKNDELDSKSKYFCRIA